MINFTCRCTKRDGTPVIRDTEIMDYAEQLLNEYRPKMLKEPGKINADHFLESYLGASLDYQDIYYEKESIAGATVFNDSYVRVFDHKHMSIKDIAVPAGTIIIDNDTLENDSFALFTKLHEGGHFCLHKSVYCINADQINIFNTEQDNCALACRKSSIGYRRGRLVTDHDFREHQANTFAAAIAMPRPTFIPMVSYMIKSRGFRDGVWVQTDESIFNGNLELNYMAEQIAHCYGTSRTATKVHMAKLGLLVHEKDIRSRNRQVGIAL